MTTKKIKQHAAPEFTTDADGRHLVHVALANTDQRATLYAEDYLRLMAAGFSPLWTLTNTGGRFQYVLVCARSPSNSRRSLTVARLIADAGKGQHVSYADGDRLNLRRENLELVQGSAKAAAAWLKPNDGTPPRRKVEAQTQDAHAAPVRPSQTPQTPAATTAASGNHSGQQGTSGPHGTHSAHGNQARTSGPTGAIRAPRDRQERTGATCAGTCRRGSVLQRRDEPMITLSAVRPEVIPELAARLSREDLAELEHRGWQSPADAVREAVAVSDEAFMASWDGEVQAVFGVAEWHGERPEGMLRVGMPWLLCAAPPPRIQMTFMRMADEVMARWSRTFPALVACVDAGHTRARRWLASLGLNPVVEQQHSGFPVIGCARFNSTGDHNHV